MNTIDRAQISSVPIPKWKQLSHRRLQAHPSPLSSTNTLLATTLPEWLSNPILPRLLALPFEPLRKENLFSHAPHLAPNHCLINEYLPGQGIHPHEDGDAYHPIVATVSLGSHIILDVKTKLRGGDGQQSRILQEPRSILITTGALYSQCLHSISEVESDKDLREGSIVNWGLLGDKTPFAAGFARRETRVSLTFRDVKKVQKLGKAFKVLGK